MVPYITVGLVGKRDSRGANELDMALEVATGPLLCPRTLDSGQMSQERHTMSQERPIGLPLPPVLFKKETVRS